MKTRVDHHESNDLPIVQWNCDELDLKLQPRRSYEMFAVLVWTSRWGWWSVTCNARRYLVGWKFKLNELDVAVRWKWTHSHLPSRRYHTRVSSFCCVWAWPCLRSPENKKKHHEIARIQLVLGSRPLPRAPPITPKPRKNRFTTHVGSRPANGETRLSLGRNPKPKGSRPQR